MEHSLCGGLLCGGGDDKDDYSKRSCLLLDPRTGRFDCTLAWLVKGSCQSRKRIYLYYEWKFPFCTLIVDPQTNWIIFLISLVWQPPGMKFPFILYFFYFDGFPQTRKGHMCWEVDGEGGDTLLLGGYHSTFSTELVTYQGRSSSSSFRLKHSAE